MQNRQDESHYSGGRTIRKQDNILPNQLHCKTQQCKRRQSFQYQNQTQNYGQTIFNQPQRKITKNYIITSDQKENKQNNQMSFQNTPKTEKLRSPSKGDSKTPLDLKRQLMQQESAHRELKQIKCKELNELKIQYRNFLQNEAKMSDEEFKRENEQRIDKIINLQQQAIKLEELQRLSEQNLRQMDFGDIKQAKYLGLLEEEYKIFSERMGQYQKVIAKTNQ